MIKKIAVLGSGTMGHEIAEAFALYGYDVNLYDADKNRLRTAKNEIREELELLAEENFITDETIQKTLDAIKLSTDLKTTVVDRDYVIEAVPEIMKLTQNLSKELDQYCLENTIFARSIASLPLDELAAFLSNKSKW
jgi:3-hydroxybutyryl-CoA dehydrogenase